MPTSQTVANTEVTKPPSVHERLIGFLSDDKPAEKPVEKSIPSKPTKSPNQKQETESDEQKTEVKEETRQEIPADDVEETEELGEETPETEEAEEAEQEEEVKLPATQEELAEKLGLEPEKLMDLKFKTKIDGQEGEVTLASLLKSYQIDSSINRKSQDLSEAKKTFEQETQTIRGQQSEILGNLRSSLTLAVQMLQGEYAAVDWAGLEQTDPNQYLIMRQKFQDRNAQIEQAYQTLQEKDQESTQENKRKFESYYQDQQTKLANSIPEWKNEETAKKDKQAIKEYLKVQGYSDQEIGSLYDHRFVMVMRDAMRYRDLTKKKQAAMKKVVTAPKLSKPGAQKVTDTSDSTRYNQQREQLRKTGKVPRGLLERFV